MAAVIEQLMRLFMKKNKNKQGKPHEVSTTKLIILTYSLFVLFIITTLIRG